MATRQLDWFRPGELRLCRSCGRAFKPTGAEVEFHCPALACALWAEDYERLLAAGIPPPLEYGMAPLAPAAPVVAPRRSKEARREARRVARRFEAQANANQNQQIAREKASRARGEVEISAGRYL